MVKRAPDLARAADPLTGQLLDINRRRDRFEPTTERCPRAPRPAGDALHRRGLQREDTIEISDRDALPSHQVKQPHCFRLSSLSIHRPSRAKNPRWVATDTVAAERQRDPAIQPFDHLQLAGCLKNQYACRFASLVATTIPGDGRSARNAHTDSPVSQSAHATPARSITSARPRAAMPARDHTDIHVGAPASTSTVSANRSSRFTLSNRRPIPEAIRNRTSTSDPHGADRYRATMNSPAPAGPRA